MHPISQLLHDSASDHEAPSTSAAPIPPQSALLRPARPSNAEIAAWLVLGAGALLVFVEDLVPGLIAGLIFYLLLDAMSASLSKRVSGAAVRPLALLLGTLVAGAVVTGATMLVLSIVRAQMRNIPALMTKMAEILESTRLLIIKLGGYSIHPEAIRDAEDLKEFAAAWLKLNAGVIGVATETFSLALIHIVMGLLLAMMVFLRHTRSREHIANRGPLAKHLLNKVKRLTTAFTQVITAQLYISAINTTLTATYLLVALPLAGRKLPFSMTIVFITFVCGLIPVLGNLISNTVIVIVSMGISAGTAYASLAFLVVIHKLEYVVNSKIIGSKTGSDIWEILLAIIIGEAAFGIQGMILAPVIYTFAKRELKDWKVV